MPAKFRTTQRPGERPSHERTAVQRSYQLLLYWLHFYANTVVRTLFGLLLDARTQQFQKHTSPSTYQTIRLYILQRICVGGDFYRHRSVNLRGVTYILQHFAGASQRLVGRK